MSATGRQYRESDHFAAGDRLVLAETRGLTLGLTICYDLRFPQLLYRACQGRGRHHHGAFGSPSPSGRAHRHVLLRARAIETGSFIIAPAQCGTHADGRRTYGHALIVSPWGEILAEAPTDDANAQAGANDGFVHADIDITKVEKARNAIPSLGSDAAFE